MKENEREQSQKDGEIEISNLDPSPSSPVRKPRFSPRQRLLCVILLNSLLILVLVFILVNTASVRELVSTVFIRPTSAPTVVAGSSLPSYPDASANARLGGPRCHPPSPLDASNLGFLEAPGTSPARDLWVLFLSGIPAVKTDNKIALRIGTHFQETPYMIGLGPRGQHLLPLFLDEHGGSDWNRPGNEWGADFNFPVAGCWDLHVTSGTTAGDVWIVVS